MVRTKAGDDKAAELQSSPKQMQTSPSVPRMLNELQSSSRSVTAYVEAVVHDREVFFAGSVIERDRLALLRCFTTGILCVILTTIFG